MSMDPFKQKLRPVNPLPDSRFPADDPALGADAGPEDIARAGYHVLDRANPRNPWNPHRQGISDQVYDYPMPDDY